MKNCLQNYLNNIAVKNPSLAAAIKQTTDDIVPEYIANFSFKEHVVSLLVGDVQSGKTSHMFGLMCAAADEGFPIFLLLTTDNVLLQQQTYKRAQAASDRTKLSELLNISTEQMSYITNADAGCGLMKYGASLVPFVNKFPKNTELYKLITTRPGEGVMGGQTQ